MRKVDHAHGVSTVEEFLDAETCSTLVARAKSIGFSSAPITTHEGPAVRPDIRSNDRVMIDDPGLAAHLWAAIRPMIPSTHSGREAAGLNERFRFYRYQPGQRFSWHADGVFKRASGEQSFLTFMVYLNQGFEGGDTKFEFMRVKAHIGMALWFPHGLIHEGAEVTAGEKFVLRSDVMYA